MDRQALLQRYRLALQLIPDVDVAGDLFMEAADEDDLRRLATRWRRKRGLDPAPGPDQTQMDLTPDQEEDALHLARRAQLRRRFRRGLVAFGGLALIAVLVLFWTRLPDRSSLAAEPSFARSPIGLAESGPYTAAIYRAEASPGAVTIWWELTGPALSVDHLPVPQLTLAGSGVEWLEPAAHNVDLPSSNRLVARSTFNSVAIGRRVAVLQLQIGQTPQYLLVRAPLTRIAAEDGTRELALPAPIRTHSLERVALAPTYTLVRYRTPNPAHFIGVDGPAWRLRPLGPPRVLDDGVYEAIFEAVPPGAHGALTVRLERGTDIRWYSLPAAEELTGVRQDGNHVTVQMAFSTYLTYPPAVTPLPLPAWNWTPEQAYLTLGETNTGIHYPAHAVYQGEDPIRNLTLWRLEANLPPDTPAAEAVVWVPRINQESLATFTVPLQTKTEGLPR